MFAWLQIQNEKIIIGRDHSSWWSMIAQKHKFSGKVLSSDSASGQKNKNGSMICFSHESGCSLSSSVNWKKFWNIFDNYCNRTWIWKSSFQSMSSRLISTNVSRICFAGWKKATTNHASHQRALVLPVGEIVSEQFCVLELPIISQMNLMWHEWMREAIKAAHLALDLGLTGR